MDGIAYAGYNSSGGCGDERRDLEQDASPAFFHPRQTSSRADQLLADQREGCVVSRYGYFAELVGAHGLDRLDQLVDYRLYKLGKSIRIEIRIKMPRYGKSIIKISPPEVENRSQRGVYHLLPIFREWFMVVSVSRGETFLTR